MVKRTSTQEKAPSSAHQARGDGSGSNNDKRTKVSRGVDEDAELMATPEDPKFAYPRVVSSAEANVDPARFSLIHGFWVPTTQSVNYRRLVEKYGHLCVHEALPVSSLVVFAEGLLDVTEGLSYIEEDPVDPETLRKWEAQIQTALALGFPVKWLKKMLVNVASSRARSTLPLEIEDLEREHRRLLRVVEAKKQAHDQLMLNMHLAMEDLKAARKEADDVSGRLDQKREELAALNMS